MYLALASQSRKVLCVRTKRMIEQNLDNKRIDVYTIFFPSMFLFGEVYVSFIWRVWDSVQSMGCHLQMTSFGLGPISFHLWDHHFARHVTGFWHEEKTNSCPCSSTWWVTWKFKNLVVFKSEERREHISFDSLLNYSCRWISNKDSKLSNN